ncbi:MAG TPA: hypothetical protein VHB79_32740 [Polyangiaceae bacterium]|nr:hypothetical protein [Polyangiaceae bacterium]
MKDYLAAVRRLPPSKQQAVLEGLDNLVEQIEGVSNLEWLPIGANLALTQAVYETLGSEAGDVFFQNWLKRQMSAPAFAGLVRTALALFRFDTVALAKWIPKAFDIMYRDYGSFVIQEEAPGHVQVQLREMPPEIAGHASWHRSVASGMHAVFFLTGVKGTTELVPSSERDCLRVALRWTQ